MKNLLPQDGEDMFGLILFVLAIAFVVGVLWKTHGLALHCMPSVPL